MECGGSFRYESDRGHANDDALSNPLISMML
jgi:hypothetical protein